MTTQKLVTPLVIALALVGCGGDSSSDDPLFLPDNAALTGDELDAAVRARIDALGLTGTPEAGRTLPDIGDPLPQLGMRLFFSKSLGGDFDSACASCHHPELGGADALSLPVGTNAVDPDRLGIGRRHADGLPPVPRNSPTVFNAGLWDSSLFWDSRVESIGAEPLANGASSGIRTPDTALNVADPNAGPNLAAAQARFPVTSEDEMRGFSFEAAESGDAVRAHLAARLGDYGEGQDEIEDNGWLAAFQTAFSSGADAETLVTFDNIALAIGEYERSMVFASNPWRNYVSGELTALDESAKRGALLFLTTVDNGGAGCINCHSGDLFSDERHHTVGFPQIGPGKGDGATADDDFGRERETGDERDRYRFRTPSLLNVAVTAPYGHTGAYATLTDVVRHYVNPRGSINGYFANERWCDLPQFATVANCEALYPNAETNSNLALAKHGQELNAGTSLFQPVRLNNGEVADVVAFLESLTDPCVESADCLAPWVPESAGAPDNFQLTVSF